MGIDRLVFGLMYRVWHRRYVDLSGPKRVDSVRFIRADVTRLGSYGIGTGVQLVADGGCLHGLSDEGRDAYVKELSAIVAPAGRLLLAGFAEGKRRGPKGFNRPEIERRFASGWELLGGGEDPEVSNISNDPIYVYDLRRR